VTIGSRSCSAIGHAPFLRSRGRRCAPQARMTPEAPLRIGRQEGERLAMKRGDRTEASFVEAEDAGGAVPRGERYERAVGETEIEIGVPRVQVDDRREISALEVPDREPPGRQVGEERSSRSRAEPPSEEVVDLGGRRCRMTRVPVSVTRASRIASRCGSARSASATSGAASMSRVTCRSRRAGRARGSARSDGDRRRVGGSRPPARSSDRGRLAAGKHPPPLGLCS
jgi:hypothetical protein